jgi:hypothetical protein
VRRVLEGWVAAFIRPRIATFKALIAGASWSGVLVSLLLAGVIAGLLRAAGSGATDQGPVESFFSGIISDWVFFCIEAAYLLVTTGLLSKPQQQQQQVYALSLFWPLLNIGPNLLIAGGSLSWLGTLLWLPAVFYGLFLTYQVIQTVPGVPPHRARFLLGVPIIVLILLGLLIFGLLTLLAGNINTLENK